MKQYYKGTRLDGWDWYTGNTINYRENLGTWVTCPDQAEHASLCSATVIHASRDPNNIFIGSQIPTSIFRVKGTPVIEDHQKSGFKKLFIINELTEHQIDQLFTWKYREATQPIHPFKLKPPQINDTHKKLVRAWASVWDSVWDSVRDSVEDSVRDSVEDSVWDFGNSVWDSVWTSVWASVWASVGNSVWASVRDSVWDFGNSVWDSVGDSVGAYVGSLFPNVKTWKYVNMNYRKGTYPFQSTVDLWRQGLVPSFDGKTWRLHGTANATILWETRKNWEGDGT